MKNLPIFISIIMILLTVSNSKDYFGEEVYYILMGLLFVSGILISIKYLEKKRILLVLLAITISIILYFINI